jgi:hypothetical protein
MRRKRWRNLNSPFSPMEYITLPSNCMGWHLDIGLPTSKSVRKYIFVV